MEILPEIFRTGHSACDGAFVVMKDLIVCNFHSKSHYLLTQAIQEFKIIFSRFRVWLQTRWMHLLTTHRHNSELKARASSTRYRTPQHSLKFFPGYCVIISSSLATASYNGNSLAFRVQVLSSQARGQNSILNRQLTTIWVAQSRSYFRTGGLPQTVRICDKPLETHHQ
jgi:hypothetical protein